MAAFVNPVDALRASQKIHVAFHPTRVDTPIRLRISVNTGPCIAVRLNSKADYFDGTVNIAAKLQALAEGYQIAMSEATCSGREETAPGLIRRHLAHRETCPMRGQRSAGRRPTGGRIRRPREPS
ncbi:MAG: Adenylate cyclase, partial [Myxococcales bacterium]|nr:Adenylate cyclase [Myxococcales bacterium]